MQVFYNHDANINGKYLFMNDENILDTTVVDVKFKCKNSRTVSLYNVREN